MMYFNEKDYLNAAGKFKEGFELLYGNSLNEKQRELIFTLGLNICNCCIKLEYYQSVLDQMPFLIKLKQDNPKLYYYRGMAHAHLGNMVLAEEDLYKLQELVPTSDPGVVNLKQMVESKQPKPDTKIFKSIFAGNMYEKNPYKKKTKEF